MMVSYLCYAAAVLAFLIPINNQAFAKTGPFSKYLMKKSEKVATQHLNKFPGSQYMTLNLGLTTVLSSAQMRIAYESIGVNPDQNMRDLMIENLKKIATASEADRLSYLEALIPKQAELGGREIVMHRVLWEGITMIGAMVPILDFMQQRRPGVKLSFSFVITDFLKEDFSRDSLPEIFEHPSFGKMNLQRRNEYAHQQIDIIVHGKGRELLKTHTPFQPAVFPKLPPETRGRVSNENFRNVLRRLGWEPAQYVNSGIDMQVVRSGFWNCDGLKQRSVAGR